MTWIARVASGHEDHAAALALVNVGFRLHGKGGGSDVTQLPTLTKLVERASAIVRGPAGNWLYLVEGNLRVSINIAGPNPHGEAESTHLLDVEMRFAENVVARVREPLLRKA